MTTYYETQSGTDEPTGYNVVDRNKEGVAWNGCVAMLNTGEAEQHFYHRLLGQEQRHSAY